MARCDQQGALWVISRKGSVCKTRFLRAAGNYPQRVPLVYNKYIYIEKEENYNVF